MPDADEYERRMEAALAAGRPGYAMYLAERLDRLPDAEETE